MASTFPILAENTSAELPTILQRAGIVGAGGAGFPAYAKWTRVAETDHLLVNHQESEPVFYKDKWLGRAHAEEFAALFDALLEDELFETIVVAAKLTDRDEWMSEFEAATDASVRHPGDLPLDPDEQSGVTIAYTDDRYEYGMESVLLRLVADIVVGTELPMDHGWLVQNTETLYNIARAFDDETPVTHKYVHVDGETPRHRFLEVPIGTPATDLLRAADRQIDELTPDQLLADGGPGWCFEIDDPPDRFGVRKRTNCLLALDADVAAAHTFGGERINVLHALEWDRDHETEPNATLDPATVRVPRISNPSLRGLVYPGDPVVEPGDAVEAGTEIAAPNPAGFSTSEHAPIDGTITAVTDTHIEIQAS